MAEWLSRVDHTTNGAAPEHALRPATGPARVVALRDWAGGSALRLVRPGRALYTPRIVPVAGGADVGIRPATKMPERSWPLTSTRAAVLEPVLIVICSESRMVDRLRAALPTVGVVQNPGGQVPRSPRAPRCSADVVTIEAALEEFGARHVVCVGHLGCHAARASHRHVPPGNAATADRRARDVRAIEYHVFNQMHHLRAYLRRRGSHPAMRVSGLWVDEDTGHVSAFDPNRRSFALLQAFDLERYSTMVRARVADAAERVP